MAKLTNQEYHNIMLSRNSRLILLLQNGRTEMATDTIFGAMLTKTATRMCHSINVFLDTTTEKTLL